MSLVDLHGREDDCAESTSAVAIERQKADERARSERRRVIICDSALLLDRALFRSPITETALADGLGVSRAKVRMWRQEPLDSHPSLYSILGHDAVSIEVSALLLERVEQALVTGAVDVDLEPGLRRVLAAATRIETLLARRSR